MPIDTLGDTDRLADVLHSEIAICHIVDGPAAAATRLSIVGDVRGFALPSLDPGAIR